MTISTGPAGIRPLRTPPDGFDPCAASELELRRYGLPRRPDAAVRPELAARWDEVFSRKLRYITPEFTPENGTVVATTTVETPTLIKIAYTGS